MDNELNSDDVSGISGRDPVVVSPATFLNPLEYANMSVMLSIAPE